MKFAILSLGLLAAAGVARGDDEEKVALEDLPKAVLSAVKEKFPEGKPTSAEKETEDGKTKYEVVVEDGGKTVEVSVSPKGKVTESETKIDPKDLPAAVTATLAAEYPKGRIAKAEKVVKYGKKKDRTGYEVAIVGEDKKEVEVKLNAKGKIQEAEEDEEDDAKPGDAKKEKDGAKAEEPGKAKDNG
ncbi:PepSY domain-containing protein [Tundrisphaera sp. TA3]|uniref:PepSY domain-containing protein n=1 Tax=Tundrisphaera sp. TA3 TaxID=3435775 RepID=UPI003EBAB9FE